MTVEERMELANELCKVLSGALARNLCTGTGKQFRERKQELARLMARVSGVVMYDGMPESERDSRTKHLEDEMRNAVDSGSNHIWSARDSGSGPSS